VIDACPHHEHRSHAQGRLCLAVRTARPHIKAYSADKRVCELLSLVVHSHELDARGDDGAMATVAERIEARARELSPAETSKAGRRS
jgi:hypothetical protein